MCTQHEELVKEQMACCDPGHFQAAWQGLSEPVGDLGANSR